MVNTRRGSDQQGQNNQGQNNQGTGMPMPPPLTPEQKSYAIVPSSRIYVKTYLELAAMMHEKCCLNEIEP